jgi:polyhydroxyalkanoate synthesis regulator phasin
MQEVENTWIEELKTEEARDLVEEIMDLLVFGIKDPEDREDANRLIEDLKNLGEITAAEELSKKIQK